MRKLIRLSLLIFFLPNMTYAQSEEVMVEKVIEQLFEGMYKADTTLLRSAFVKEITMATVFRNKEGKQMLTRENSINDWANSVASSAPKDLSEEIWNLKIQVDGDFAQAWCDYAFYYKNKFSHCGVDAFQLFKTQEGWKVFHLADTRRKEGCTVPQEIQNKYK